MDCSNRTGEYNCLINKSFISWQSVTSDAVTLAYTGTLALFQSIDCKLSENVSLAGFIRDEWKGPLTVNGTTRLAPASKSNSPASSRPFLVPEITICPG